MLSTATKTVYVMYTLERELYYGRILAMHIIDNSIVI